MKKTFIILVLSALSALVTLQAQDNLDTVYGRQPEYYYTYWYDTSAWYNNLDSLNLQLEGRAIGFSAKGFGPGGADFLLSAQMHTDQPIKVKGVALMVSNVAGRPDDPPYMRDGVLDSVKMPEYVYLLRYEEEENPSGRYNRQTVIDSARWDTLKPKVYCLPRAVDGRYEPLYCYVYEVKFDTEYTVEG